MKLPIEIHNELNPKLWNGDSLLPKIKRGIFKVVKEFENYIEAELPIIDIVLIGSNASYNYNDNSDLDVHIVINFADIDDNKELVGKLMEGYKSQFNAKYDIDFVGINVEIYVEDMKSSANSNGIYSVLNDEWIKYPEPIEMPEDIDIDDDYEEIKTECEDAVNSGTLEEITELINQLYYQRKLALQVDGEFSVGNLIFKALRNDGTLDALKDKQTELKSKELCVEGLRR